MGVKVIFAVLIISHVTYASTVRRVAQPLLKHGTQFGKSAVMRPDVVSPALPVARSTVFSAGKEAFKKNMQFSKGGAQPGLRTQVEKGFKENLYTTVAEELVSGFSATVPTKNSVMSQLLPKFAGKSSLFSSDFFYTDLTHEQPQPLLSQEQNNTQVYGKNIRMQQSLGNSEQSLISSHAPVLPGGRNIMLDQAALDNPTFTVPSVQRNVTPGMSMKAQDTHVGVRGVQNKLSLEPAGIQSVTLPELLIERDVMQGEQSMQNMGTTLPLSARQQVVGMQAMRQGQGLGGDLFLTQEPLLQPFKVGELGYEQTFAPVEQKAAVIDTTYSQALVEPDSLRMLYNVPSQARQEKIAQRGIRNKILQDDYNLDLLFPLQSDEVQQPLQEINLKGENQHHSFQGHALQPHAAGNVGQNSRKVKPSPGIDTNYNQVLVEPDSLRMLYDASSTKTVQEKIAQRALRKQGLQLKQREDYNLDVLFAPQTDVQSGVQILEPASQNQENSLQALSRSEKPASSFGVVKAVQGLKIKSKQDVPGVAREEQNMVFQSQKNSSEVLQHGRPELKAFEHIGQVIDTQIQQLPKQLSKKAIIGSFEKVKKENLQALQNLGHTVSPEQQHFIDQRFYAVINKINEYDKDYLDVFDIAMLQEAMRRMSAMIWNIATL